MTNKPKFYEYSAKQTKAPSLWTVAFILFISLNFFIFMGFDILLPTLSLYLESHGNSQSDIGRIFGAFTVSAVIMRMSASRLAYRFESIWLIRIGILACSLVGISYIKAVTLTSGMAVRFLHGAGFGLASTLLMALASQAIPPSRLAEGLGYLGLGTTVALAVGPLFGLWMVENFGYFSMFVVVSAFCGTAGIITFFLPDIKLASSEVGAPKPKLVFISKKVWAPSLLMFLVGLIMSTIIIYMALFCKEKDLPYAGHFFVISTIGIFVSRFTCGRIHDRLGHVYVLVPAALMLISVMLLLYNVNSRNMLFVASILYGLGTGAAFPSVQAIAISAVPMSGRTEAAASLFNSLDIGIGAGALFFGFVASRSFSYISIYLYGSLVGVFMLVFYLIYFRILPQKTTVPQNFDD